MLELLDSCGMIWRSEKPWRREAEAAEHTGPGRTSGSLISRTAVAFRTRTPLVASRSVASFLGCEKCDTVVEPFCNCPRLNGQT